MSEIKNEELRMLANSWQRAIDAKDWDSAILAGISAYLHFASQGEDRLKQGAVGLISAAFQIRDQTENGGNQVRCFFLRQG